MPYIPHKNNNGNITWTKVKELPVSCPYCGHNWIFKGEDKHYVTCHGTDTIKNHPEYRETIKKYRIYPEYPSEEDWTWKCEKKVRLHPYLIKTHKKITNKILFPNKNYEMIILE